MTDTEKVIEIISKLEKIKNDLEFSKSLANDVLNKVCSNKNYFITNESASYSQAVFSVSTAVINQLNLIINNYK